MGPLKLFLVCDSGSVIDVTDKRKPEGFESGTPIYAETETEARTLYSLLPSHIGYFGGVQ